MPCSRCSMCGVNYPYGTTPCPVCGGKTDGISNDSPDKDWQETVERMRAEAPHRARAEALREWKLERLLELGVPLEDAEALARRRDSWHEAQELVARGCAPVLVGQILL